MRSAHCARTPEHQVPSSCMKCHELTFCCFATEKGYRSEPVFSVCCSWPPLSHAHKGRLRSRGAFLTAMVVPVLITCSTVACGFPVSRRLQLTMRIVSSVTGSTVVRTVFHFLLPRGAPAPHTQRPPERERECACIMPLRLIALFKRASL